MTTLRFYGGVGGIGGNKILQGPQVRDFFNFSGGKSPSFRERMRDAEYFR